MARLRICSRAAPVLLRCSRMEMCSDDSKRVSMVHHGDSIKSIYQASLASVSPSKLVKDVLHFDKGKGLLKAGQKCYKIDRNVVVVGFGKAVLEMLKGVKSVLDPHIVRGVMSVPYASSYEESDYQRVSHYPVRICEGGRDNLPDRNSVENTKAIVEQVQASDNSHLVIVLISGGGSALLCHPAEGISLEDLIYLTKTVAGAGATIQELNKCRIVLSQVKGGKLAKMAFPAQVMALILSDIINSPLHLIASGPTVAVKCDNLQSDVLSIIEKYKLRDKLSSSVLTFLHKPYPQLPACTTDVQNILVGDNKIAALAASHQTKLLGYNTLILSFGIVGEARTVGSMYAALAFQLLVKTLACDGCMNSDPSVSQLLEDAMNYNSELAPFLSNALLPVCIIGAGETTVTLKGSGKGGRNQELVLGFSAKLHKLLHQCQPQNPAWTSVHFCSLGTDGQDGPTDVAGAHVSGVNAMKWNYQDIQTALENNDSYHFFERYKECFINTGLTGTNVMDIQVLLVG